MINKNGDAFLRLVKIMDELREQCPWDKKQTIQTLRQLTIEETYELTDAITDEDWKGIKEELGDLLLHIVFYAKIGNEQKQFQLDEVINGVCEKLISRHPHIYGDPDNEGKLVNVKSEEDVKRNWEKLKLKEGKKSVISGVPKSLPATVKAMRLQEKAKQVGFEWEVKEQVWEKVEEEMAELKTAITNLEAVVKDHEKAFHQKEVEAEFGDLIFSLINYARFLQVDAENALELTNKKFIHRFTKMEEAALQGGKDLHSMTLEEMDAIWNTIKKQRADK
ncbi:MAG: nucleoside triphosphate pyrophosphohydrolase [Chitinophagaceae bacterium]|nr:nucleoside triphosphate pyrophosphohydrolase [Chitinophagaceae bacterium]MBK8605958.1 nucleoside triphosphate pyrophosphohydrolase [Chitinophagaceae bacterium]MBP6476891.1 nucleoside triphosphate pyrophosphohydrolase [Chitinophagaceae bacterium]MBP7108385.1 nucleoside triphosphate pyrophosphohydrolase [Chitinophagaceae bacterium]MBP7314125.1 nucleoside triphosphate pyrophosphohydrolase [Chitinophagaceae bacterium]